MYRVGPSPSEIKNARQSMTPSCTTCFKAGEDFKRCNRCKSTCYCSKECQKKDWPRHKRFCRESDGPARSKLLENLMANKILHFFLQFMLVLEFDILNNPDLIRKPFVARIDFAMEPVELEDLRSLIESKDDVSKPMQGMFQLTSLISALSGAISPPLTAMRQHIWDVARRNADAAGSVDTAVGLVEFVNNNASQSTTVAIHISKGALIMLRDNPPALIPTAPGDDEYIAKPMSIYTCMEVINASIRFDTEDRWLLRKPMFESDREIIRDIPNNPKTFPALAFQEKMERELIYEEL